MLILSICQSQLEIQPISECKTDTDGRQRKNIDILQLLTSNKICHTF